MIELLLLALAVGPRLADSVTGLDTWIPAVVIATFVAALLIYKTRDGGT